MNRREAILTTAAASSSLMMPRELLGFIESKQTGSVSDRVRNKHGQWETYQPELEIARKAKKDHVMFIHIGTPSTEGTIEEITRVRTIWNHAVANKNPKSDTLNRMADEISKHITIEELLFSTDHLMLLQVGLEDDPASHEDIEDAACLLRRDLCAGKRSFFTNGRCRVFTSDQNWGGDVIVESHDHFKPPYWVFNVNNPNEWIVRP